MIHLKISEEKLVLMERKVKYDERIIADKEKVENTLDFANLSKMLGELRYIWIALCNDNRYTETARKASDLATKLCYLLDGTDFEKLEVWK